MYYAYSPGTVRDHSTSDLSVLSLNTDAVALTSTVNIIRTLVSFTCYNLDARKTTCGACSETGTQPCLLVFLGMICHVSQYGPTKTRTYPMI